MTDARRASRQLRRVGCEEACEAVSARFDGEQIGINGRELDAHLASCTACQDFEAQVTAIGRQVRLRPARPVPEELVATLAPLLMPSARHFVGAHRLAGTAQWAGATMSVVLAALGLSLGVGSNPHLVPTRPPSPCTVGLLAHYRPGGS